MKQNVRMSVGQMSKLTGVSESKLRYYDEIGLLTAARNDAGYRMYTEADIDRLSRIVTLQKLGFALEEIRRMLDDTDFDFDQVFSDRIHALREEKETTEAMLGFAKTIRLTGILPQELGFFRNGSAEENAEKAAERFHADHAVRAMSDTLSRLPYSYLEHAEQTVQRLAACTGDDPAAAHVQAMIAELYEGMNEHIAAFPPEMFAMMIPILTSGGGYAKQFDRMGESGRFSEFLAQAIRIFTDSRSEKEEVP